MMPIDVSPVSYFDAGRPEMVNFIPADAHRILDVGCHTGAFGLELKNTGHKEVWGIEPNEVSRGIAEMRLDKVLGGYFSDGAALPDNYFDAIVFNDVLEHMADPWSALQLARKKLRPDGRVVVSLPNVRHIENLFHLIEERDFRYEPEGIRDVTHLRFFTKKSISRLFDNSGLSIVTLQGINPYLWTPSIIRRIAFRVLSAMLGSDTRYVQFAVVAKAN